MVSLTLTGFTWKTPQWVIQLDLIVEILLLAKVIQEQVRVVLKCGKVYYERFSAQGGENSLSLILKLQLSPYKVNLAAGRTTRGGQSQSCLLPKHKPTSLLLFFILTLTVGA